jgi:hypothetical protein
MAPPGIKRICTYSRFIGRWAKEDEGIFIQEWRELNHKVWWAHRDLNLEPTDYEGGMKIASDIPGLVNFATKSGKT